MRLVERHVIKPADPRFAAIDAAAFASKNLYNAANYELRQAFLLQGVYLTYPQMHQRMKEHEAYQALPAKVAQWVLRTLDKSWQSFFAARAACKDDPSKFVGRPRLPGYKDKQQGRNLLVYTVQALSIPALRDGLIRPSMLDVNVRTKRQPHTIQQVRIIARIGYYKVEVGYEHAPVPAAVTPTLHAGVDIGLNNLATLTSDQPGFVPRIVNMRPVKSINQFYNKRRAELQRRLGAQAYRHIRAGVWSGSPPSARDALTTTCTPHRVVSSICSWLRGSARCASARTRSGSRKRTWAGAPIRPSSRCRIRA